MAELMKASHQWRDRPADERFADLESLLATTRAQRDRSLKSTVMMSDLKAHNVNGELVLSGGEEQNATMSHWAFSQLTGRVGAPADYLRRLPVELVEPLLNHGLRRLSDEQRIAQMLFWRLDKNPVATLQARAFTSEQYTRVWNYEIVERLMGLGAQWQVPPALGSKPSGLYAGDHDMFAFMVDDDRRVNDGSAEGLGRGFFVWNTEVGGVAFGMDTFLYRYVCGNHIVWGATNVTRVRVRHVGAADARAWSALERELVAYADQGTQQEEQRIRAAQSYSLGSTEENVIERAFKMSVAPKRALKEAYALTTANEAVDGNPRTVWGLMQGLTRLSQRTEYADQRVTLDRGAAKLMALVG